MNDHEHNKIADEVLDEIKSGGIKMRPKYYYILGSLALGIGLGLTLLGTLFFIGVVTFRFRAQAPFDFLSFGTKGFNPFIANLPWLPGLIAVAGIVIGVILLRKYRLGYRHSLVTLLIVMVALVGTVGIALEVVGAHRPLEKAPGFIKMYHKPHCGDKWLGGTVQSIDNSEIIILTPDDEEAIIIFDNDTIFRPPERPVPDEWLKAIGEWDDDNFEATHLMHGTSDRFLMKVKGEQHQRPMP
ncbi:MAG: hypothetical protein V1838_01395 [Patescibacteria group bacterium]